jgi:hypothetical protein
MDYVFDMDRIRLPKAKGLCVATKSAGAQHANVAHVAAEHFARQPPTY